MSPALRTALLAKWPALAPVEKGRHKGFDPLSGLDDAIRAHALAIAAVRAHMTTHERLDAEASASETSRCSGELQKTATELVKIGWRFFPVFGVAAGSELHRAFRRCDPAVAIDMFDASGASDRPTRFPPRSDRARIDAARLLVAELGPSFGYRVASHANTSPLVALCDHPLRKQIVTEQTRIDSPAPRAPDKRQGSMAGGTR